MLSRATEYFEMKLETAFRYLIIFIFYETAYSSSSMRQALSDKNMSCIVHLDSLKLHNTATTVKPVYEFLNHEYRVRMLAGELPQRNKDLIFSTVTCKAISCEVSVLCN